MVIAQAAAEYGALAGFARVIDEVIFTADAYIGQTELTTWLWIVGGLLVIWYTFRAPR